jgi:hypothetical protein
MGLAIDTIVGAATNPSTTVTAVTMNSGDSATVRNASPNSPVYLDELYRQGVTEGYVRFRSPLLHDMVQGIRFTPSETPTRRLLPPWVDQLLRPQDPITFEVSGGSAEVDAVAANIWYGDLGGAAARIHSLGDIAGLIKNIKPLEVDWTSAGTAANWVDTVITTTENLLHANTDYAVLGYITDTASLVVGVKGIDTSNLRICGPGVTASEVTQDWFVRQAQWTGRPYIPVFNSANQGSVYVTGAAVATGSAIKTSLILAELSHNL